MCRKATLTFIASNWSNKRNTEKTMLFRLSSLQHNWLLPGNCLEHHCLHAIFFSQILWTINITHRSDGVSSRTNIQADELKVVYQSCCVSKLYQPSKWKLHTGQQNWGSYNLAFIILHKFVYVESEWTTRCNGTIFFCIHDNVIYCFFYNNYIYS